MVSFTQGFNKVSLSLSLSTYVTALRQVAIAVILIASGILSAHVAVADDSGAALADTTTPTGVEIYRWDPVTRTWIRCSVTPSHIACSGGGVIPLPLGPTVIPVNVGGGASCGGAAFSLSGNASLPVACSPTAPCVIQGVQVSCTATPTQVTCTFSTIENGQWVPQGSTTVGVNDVIDVVADCAGNLTRTVRRLIDRHLVLCPVDAGTPSFPVGNPSDPQPVCIPLIGIKF